MSADVARELHNRHREWLVVWSSWTEEFLAFPLWPGQAGSLVTDHDVRELERRMGLLERACRD
ncbi:hypothetical protein J4573_43080 [Actinomadura barringtoniae]|uniref:Uncharacterized protein n=1 Tax=Actinomadura barringtoniae TaxID=1427535 RepID=A0A939PKD0_9ACTN|nr:hypothetical protein [Actinomadura barringtoniae]MBO2453935.1 hypothetical protein [Actinomadura barringtoniae]